MSQVVQPRDVLAVQGQQVAPGDTERFEYEFPEPARLDGMRIVCYAGQRWDLRYTVEHYDESSDRWQNVVTELGDVDAIGGNQDTYDFPVHESLDVHDKLRLTLENQSSEHAYTANWTANIDYPGSER